MSDSDKILEISQKLHAIAAAGNLYSKDKFDIERFGMVDDLAAELTSLCVDEITKQDIVEIFGENAGYQTPKCDTRAVVFNSSDEVLLIKDYDGKWALPGGWCDFDQTVISNTIKEAREEAGIEVRPYRLVAIHSHKKRNNPKSFFCCFRYFMLCEMIGGSFCENSETTESKFFSLDNLPADLNTHKNTKEQIVLCLEASKSDLWIPEID